MKTKEELNALKEEVVTLNEKLHELTEDELKQVTGGTGPVYQLADKKSPVYEYEDVSYMTGKVTE